MYIYYVPIDIIKKFRLYINICLRTFQGLRDSKVSRALALLLADLGLNPSIS